MYSLPFVAKGSIAEVQSLLYLTLDQDYLNQQECSGLYDIADEVARIISGFITSLIREAGRNHRR